MKITVKSQEDRKAVKKIDIIKLLTAIKTKEPKEAVKEIITARRLLSGDILILILTERVRIAFERSSEWLRAVAPTAEVLYTTFLVFVHGVRV